MSDGSDFVLIGLLRRAHGVSGEITVEPVSDITERFSVLDKVLVRTTSGIEELAVERVRYRGRRVLLKLEGIDDRAAAEGLWGAEIGVKRDDVFPVPDGTFYVFDVVGCMVLGQGDRVIGVVEDVLRMPANDVFVVKTENGEVLIPAVKAVVKSIDVTGKKIVVEEVEGLLG